MQNIATLISILLLVIISAPEQAIAQSEDEQALRYLKEVEWPKAYREQDVELLDRILADEFQMIDASGEWSNKEKELEWISNNKPSYDSFKFVITRLDIFENGTAIVAGTGYVKGSDKDGAYEMEYQSSNVLIKRKVGWKAIASHVSGIKRKTGV